MELQRELVGSQQPCVSIPWVSWSSPLQQEVATVSFTWRLTHGPMTSRLQPRQVQQVRHAAQNKSRALLLATCASCRASVYTPKWLDSTQSARRCFHGAPPLHLPPLLRPVHTATAVALLEMPSPPPRLHPLRSEPDAREE